MVFRTLETLDAALLALSVFLCMVLAGCSEDGDVEGPAKRLHHESVRVRLEAVEALEGSEDPRAVEPLILALKDEDQRVRGAAEGALAKIGRPAVEPLINALKD